MCKKGFTLIELLIVIGIIGILAAVAVPGYIGHQKRAERLEAYTNLENLRLLEEQFFAENGDYTPHRGVCAKDNNNIPNIQFDLTGFRPGSDLKFSYCIRHDRSITSWGVAPCFTAFAYGNTGTRVNGEEYRIDCRNNRFNF